MNKRQLNTFLIPFGPSGTETAFDLVKKDMKFVRRMTDSNGYYIIRVHDDKNKVVVKSVPFNTVEERDDILREFLKHCGIHYEGVNDDFLAQLDEAFGSNEPDFDLSGFDDGDEDEGLDFSDFDDEEDEDELDLDSLFE